VARAASTKSEEAGELGRRRLRALGVALDAEDELTLAGRLNGLHDLAGRMRRGPRDGQAGRQLVATEALVMVGVDLDHEVARGGRAQDAREA
jgi:hypothetical protein